MVMVNESPVISKSKLQNSVSLSTAEAEYVALSLCIQDILWTKILLMEMKVKIDARVVVYEDNQSAIAIAKNERYQSQAKHIAIPNHFVLDQVNAKFIRLEYIKTKSQLADIMTKAILNKTFQFLVARQTSETSSRGGVLMMNNSCTLKRRDDIWLLSF